MKIAILGAGISGLSIGQLLKSKHDVTIYEISNKIGGLIKCERINNCLYHKVGGHVFNAKNQFVTDWFWSFFEKDEFTFATRNAKILFNNSLLGYPIENYLFNLNEDLLKKIISDLLFIQKKPLKNPIEYPNFECFLKGNFGETLFEIYFEPYNKKIWATDLSEISMSWLDGKLPTPNISEIIYNNFTRRAEEDMVHSYFYYPKNEGSQFIVDRLSKNLSILTNVNPNKLAIKESRFKVLNQEFDKIIYTGDIRLIPDEIKQLLVDNGIVWNEVLKLRSSGTSNLFCECDETDISWLYIPQNYTSAHRIIYTGNFSNTNNKGSKRLTCVVEFSGFVSYESMINEIKKLPGNLVPLASNYEPNSYIIQNIYTRKLLGEIKNILEYHNIFLLGRFAEWEYYNMDKAIEAAMLLKEKIG